MITELSQHANALSCNWILINDMQQLFENWRRYLKENVFYVDVSRLLPSEEIGHGKNDKGYISEKAIEEKMELYKQGKFDPIEVCNQKPVNPYRLAGQELAEKSGQEEPFYFVLDGHHRLEAAKRMGISKVPAYLTQKEAPLNEDIGIDIGVDEMYLYHISSVPDIEVLDPALAARRPNYYTKQEYRTWSRPRVFFFTEWGQEDSTIGRIGGGNIYRVKLKKSELYPIYKDPLKLSYPDMKDKYEEIDPHGFGMFNVYERVATLAEKLHGFKGFIYPQGKDPNKIIVALWKKVPAEKIDKSFY